MTGWFDRHNRRERKSTTLLTAVVGVIVVVAFAAYLAHPDRQTSRQGLFPPPRQSLQMPEEPNRPEASLVLLSENLHGVSTQFGGEVTGVVINRYPRKLQYVQISFNLYDESGAQVGSAIANLNGLEPGGRWKFKAHSFGTRFFTYKLNELSGF